MGVSPSNADFMQLIYVKSNMQKWINSRINTTNISMSYHRATGHQKLKQMQHTTRVTGVEATMSGPCLGRS